MSPEKNPWKTRFSEVVFIMKVILPMYQGYNRAIISLLLINNKMKLSSIYNN